jgi:hypothetical protein
MSVEDVVKFDLESIDGVSEVGVRRAGGTFHIRVALDRFEYEVRQQVFAKELQLFDSFPDFYFDVTVTPAA